MKVLAYTNFGLKYDHNEDSYLIDGVAFNDKNTQRNDDDVYSVAVFDGVGGANAGEIASITAAQEMCKRLTATSSDEDIKDALQQANESVLRRASEQNSMHGMACTAVGLLLRKDGITAYNVGDSRVYKIKSGMMMQISTDDSYENYLIKEYGERLESSAGNHTITACLGTQNFRKEDVHINVFSAIAEGERYFLCSDGVTDYIDIDDLEDVLLSNCSFEEMSREIHRHVYENGAKDNFTFIILEK